MKKKIIPGLFRKKYTPKALNKKIIKRIHIPREREMVNKLFVENSDGKMEIIREIPEDAYERLRALSKSIKKNKGFISRWKGFVVLFIIASILIFNLFYKDKLLTRAVETGLESVFQANAELTGLHFSLIHGAFSYSSLTIADKDHSNRNLLETGPSEFRVSMAEMLSKRIRIEEMSLTDFSWDTSREVDSVVPEAPLDNNENNDDKTTEAVDFLSLGTDDIDLKALLEEQKGSLTSLNLINQGNIELNNSENKWKNIIAEKNSELDNLSGQVLSLKSISIKDTGSLAEGQLVLQKITDVYSQVAETKAELVTLKNEFEAERKHLLETNKLLESSVDKDVNRLGSIIDLSSSDGRSFVSAAAEKYIRNRWNNYYDYGLKALNVYERLQDRKGDETEKQKGWHRKSGRVFSFSGSNNPNFVIEHIFVSGKDNNSGILTAELGSVSSEPDKLISPLTFTSDWKNNSSDIKLNGFLDMRSEAERQFEMKIISPSNSISLDKGIPSLKIKKLSSLTDIRGESIVSDNLDGVVTTLDILMNDIVIEQVDKDGFISTVIKDILDNVDQVDLKVKILAGSRGIKNIKVSSSIDKILVGKMGEYINKIAAAKKEELKTELLNYIAPSLKENEALNVSMDKLGVESLSQIDSLNGMQNILNTKQDEIQSDIKSGIQDKASKLIDQVPKLKLPGF